MRLPKVFNLGKFSYYLYDLFTLNSQYIGLILTSHSNQHKCFDSCSYTISYEYSDGEMDGNIHGSFRVPDRGSVSDVVTPVASFSILLFITHRPFRKSD
ncbi:hypothetical protein NPIL_223781 [Nephila pilipes]|uniref:Uncharacterized protein n=1 Tax=Nephila pilipes TaxID=299642 RepID=A0A8X6MZP3_NEPPI|nr:hypothetical protein NPIL_223781 [Nephila pilipes]